MKHSLIRKGLVRPQLSELVINWHITEACNYNCRYCYAHWDGNARELIHDISGTRQMLENLWQFFHPENVANPLQKQIDWRGIRLNLAGGEPLLYSERLLQTLSDARNIGFTASVITNGSLLSRDFAQLIAPKLSMLGVSLDSAVSKTNRQIGRQSRQGKLLDMDALEDAIKAARLINPKLQIKLNTVINAINCDEDLSAGIRRLAPQRWKVLRMLPVVTDELNVSDEDFQRFVARHRDLGDIMCIEDNTDMVESYVMIDPLGRFFQNALGQPNYRYSPPIPKVGVAQAFAKVGIDPSKFCSRYMVPVARGLP
ncbi:MAG: viperin family antiviral radical SAM protein [Rhodocyclaceae bacterium]|nr:viperin family antiviral radical SAM protein [Rhodocyclaceae bacterium]